MGYLVIVALALLGLVVVAVWREHNVSLNVRAMGAAVSLTTKPPKRRRDRDASAS